MSLRKRITIGTVTVLAAGLAILSIALNALLANRLGADASAVLGNRADAQVATLDATSGTLRVREAPNDAALDEHGWIFDARGRALERSPADRRLTAAVEALSRVREPTERGAPGNLRLLARPVLGSGGARVGTVVVGVSLEPYRRSEQIALVGTLVLAAFVLLAGTLVALRAVGAALRPVADMTARAADWSEHDLHRRFALGPPHDELTALAATLDGLLGRIDAALRHEQRFSAEVAHELRTPLSGVRGEAELALRAGRSDAELRAALEQVLAGTDRMAAVIDTLLAAARSDAATAPGSSDAVAVARTVQRVVQPAAEAHQRRIAFDAAAEPLRVGAGEDVVAGALHPLLDNAIRHAARDVRVSVSRTGGDVLIAVGDDGAGVPAGETERIFEPGISAAGGAGLGLPLARRLARAAGGDVVAVAGAHGGRFELRLPGTA
jgi:two-component system OmpR family sensor kinase